LCSNINLESLKLFRSKAINRLTETTYRKIQMWSHDQNRLSA